MPTITNKRITHPGQLGAGYTIDDGLGLFRPAHYEVTDCIVDLSDLDLDEIDECCGITYGASASFTRCWIRGAGKLILCGSGDKNKVDVETGKRVQFYNCLLEDGGRRFPEVQDGMEVEMEECVIRNWGDPSRFDTRNFGAWAHSGGRIYALNCVFWQDSFWRPLGQFVRDICNHVGNAVNEYGLQALLRPITYLPGVCRGLMAGPGGQVSARDCWKNHWWIRLEGLKNSMPMREAYALVGDLEMMAQRLDTATRPVVASMI
ncbi:MAG: hypothetical protein IJU37_11095 [Desulfovibrio sp.]|nr:hypothetical protein [Desulfovibrio sp.]